MSKPGLPTSDRETHISRELNVVAEWRDTRQIVQLADIILQTVLVLLETVRPPSVPIKTQALRPVGIWWSASHQVISDNNRHATYFRVCHNVFFQKKRDRKRLKTSTHTGMWLKSPKYALELSSKITLQIHYQRSIETYFHFNFHEHFESWFCSVISA